MNKYLESLREGTLDCVRMTVCGSQSRERIAVYVSTGEKTATVCVSRGRMMTVCQHLGGDRLVQKQAVDMADGDSTVTMRIADGDSVCQHIGGDGLVQKQAVGLADGCSVGRGADGDSVDEYRGGDGDVIRLCVVMGDSDSVSDQRRGDSMGVRGGSRIKDYREENFNTRKQGDFITNSVNCSF